MRTKVTVEEHSYSVCHQGGLAVTEGSNTPQQDAIVGSLCHSVASRSINAEYSSSCWQLTRQIRNLQRHLLNSL